MIIDGLQNIDTTSDRVAQLEADNTRLRQAALAGERVRAVLQEKLAASEQNLERLRQAYTHALEQLQLAKRRLFMAKAERPEAVPEQLQLELLVKQVEQIGTELNQAEAAAESKESNPTSSDEPTQKTGKAKIALKHRSLRVGATWHCPACR